MSKYIRIFLHGAVKKRTVHNAPWSDCRNKNVFSDLLNREYIIIATLRFVSQPANCSTQLQRSCPRSSWRIGGQTMSSCQQNVVALLERRWQADNHRQGIPGQDRTRPDKDTILVSYNFLFWQYSMRCRSCIFHSRIFSARLLIMKHVICTRRHCRMTNAAVFLQGFRI